MTDRSNSVIVRIAPSPTGYLHVGTARTALFNYLFARSEHGKFLLRIEDTDVKRSTDEMTESILNGLKWMGLDWDEDVLHQSEHFDDYREKALELLQKGHAYWCYCSDEEIEERRRKVLKSKKQWMYDRKCYNLSSEEREKYEEKGRPRALRFLVPEGRTSYEDIIHGEIEVNNSEIEDFVILKSDGTPTYNLAVVVDDNRMGVTHILRGDDHISNTPKQILLYNAFGWEIPEFGHIPLILGKDHSKLSKRHGAVSLSSYREEGFLPEAFVNHLAFLGWSPKTEEEIFTKEELISRFSLDNVNIKPAVFEIEKLEWLNGEWIRKLGKDEIAGRLKEYLREHGYEVDDEDYLKEVIEAMGNRVKKLKDFVDIAYYFFTDDFDYDKKGMGKHFYPGLSGRIEKLTGKIRGLESFNRDNLENVLRNLSEELDCSAAELIHPVRLALSGMTFGPGLFTLMEVLGKERVLDRLERLIDFTRGGK